VNDSDQEQRADLYPDLAAVLLAGGKSRRMGADKALLSLGGQPVVQLLAARLRRLTDQVLLSANEPPAYAFLGLPIVPDVYPGRGPLAGLHAGMLHTERPLVLLLACDLPGVSSTLLRRMIEGTEGFDAVAPATCDGLLHPVCAVYRRTCMPIIVGNLRRGDNQMLSLLEDRRLHVRRLTPDVGAFTAADLMDVNSPEDYAKYLGLGKP
jgi:molybdenum cofactor guanylyltransferase